MTLSFGALSRAPALFLVREYNSSFLSFFSIGGALVVHSWCSCGSFCGAHCGSMFWYKPQFVIVISRFFEHGCCSI